MMGGIWAAYRHSFLTCFASVVAFAGGIIGRGRCPLRVPVLLPADCRGRVQIKGPPFPPERTPRPSRPRSRAYAGRRRPACRGSSRRTQPAPLGSTHRPAAKRAGGGVCPARWRNDEFARHDLFLGKGANLPRTGPQPLPAPASALTRSSLALYHIPAQQIEQEAHFLARGNALGIGPK